MKLKCEVLGAEDLGKVREHLTEISRIVQTATETLAVKIHSRAPKKSGDLIRGIVASPWEEKSAYPGKIVRQVYTDYSMNGTFVKVSKNGKRYYYPASQEYGFRISNRSTQPPAQASTLVAAPQRKRVQGKYFMRDTTVEYVPTFLADVEEFVDKVVSG